MINRKKNVKEWINLRNKLNSIIFRQCKSHVQKVKKKSFLKLKKVENSPKTCQNQNKKVNLRLKKINKFKNFRQKNMKKIFLLENLKMMKWTYWIKSTWNISINYRKISEKFFLIYF